MTRTKGFDKLVADVKRVLLLRKDDAQVGLGFRFLKEHKEEEVTRWIRDNFVMDLPFGQTSKYGNWGGEVDTSKELPFAGEWMGEKQNEDQCLIPLIACQVFPNGDVSLCSCCDYNADIGLSLGNIKDKPLLDIYNSPKAKRLWNFEDNDNIPEVCKRCSFHLPLKDLENHESFFTHPVGIIGG